MQEMPLWMANVILFAAVTGAGILGALQRQFFQRKYGMRRHINYKGAIGYGLMAAIAVELLVWLLRWAGS